MKRLFFLFLALFASAMTLPVNAESLQNTVAEIRALKAEVFEESQQNLQATQAQLAAQKKKFEQLSTLEKSLEKKVADLTLAFQKSQEELNRLLAVSREQAASQTALDAAAKLQATSILMRRAKAPLARDGDLATHERQSLQALRLQKEFPSMNDIVFLTQAAFEDIANGSTITTVKTTVDLGNGEQKALPTTFFGALSAVSFEGKAAFWSVPSPDGTGLVKAPGGYTDNDVSLFEKWQLAKSDIVPLDISNGNVFSRYQKDPTLLEHLQAGGNLVWVILAVGLLGLVTGLWQLVRLARIRPIGVVELDRLLTINNSEDFKALEGKLAEMAHRHVLAAEILSETLRQDLSSLAAVEKNFDEAGLRRTMPLKKYIALVATAAAVAPLLGLLGTITGMISTFDVITVFGNGDPKLLSGGISVALITTEVGLVVAVILMALHFALQRRLEAVTDTIEVAGALLIARCAAYFVKTPLQGYEEI